MEQNNQSYNALPHPYLAGYYCENGSEITITGFKAQNGTDMSQSSRPIYPVVGDRVTIPDEIDGVPVTKIASHAFSWSYVGEADSCFENGMAPTVYYVGKNVRMIGSDAFSMPPFEREMEVGGQKVPVLTAATIIVGKNVTGTDLTAFRECCVILYRDSDLYNAYLAWEHRNEILTDDDFAFIDESYLVSDKVKIDDTMNVYLPWGVTKETLGEYVSVEGDAKINILGDTIETGTQIELINSTYGTIDNTYTVVLEKPQITLTVEPQRTVFAKTSFRLNAAAKTTGTPCALTYTSDNADVAAVDGSGNVTTNKSGTARITVTASDKYGFTETAVCIVTVRYNWWQQLIRIFLLGWLWY